VAVSELYLGSSRMTPFRGGLEVVEHNLLGRGIHLGGAFIWGTQPRIEQGRRQQAYKIHAVAPRLGNARLGAEGAAWFVSAAEPYRVAGAGNDPDPALFRVFDYDRVGGQVGLTFPLLPQLELAAGYRFERVDAARPVDPSWVRPDGSTAQVSLDIRDGAHRHTAARFGAVWDGRREAFLAGKGGRFAFDLQASSAAVGSEYEYIRLVAGGAYSFRLPWRHWLTPSAMGGQIAGNAPIFERFHAGDLHDWTPGRELGLRYSTRNPIDVFGTGIDTRSFGDLFGRMDLEYAWPIFRRTRTRVVYGGDFVFSAGIFLLAGDRAERRARREAGELAAPVGFNANLGLRLDTALGTFDVSVGNVLQRTPL
jgi:outer membrane protein insertion porin family